MLDRQRDEPKTWIGNPRHPRVCDQSDARARLHLLHQLGRARHFVVFVVADGAGRDRVVIEQFLRLPRVFASDDIHFLQNAESAQGDVFEIADRRADQIERRSRGAEGMFLSGDQSTSSCSESGMGGVYQINHEGHEVTRRY